MHPEARNELESILFEYEDCLSDAIGAVGVDYERFRREVDRLNDANYYGLVDVSDHGD